ncbi:MAG: GIY-YIG nuclease family protein [Patescibacteria group bacterium]
MFFIYIMYNLKHDKFYIGQTYSIKKRITEHKTGQGNYTSRYDGEWLYLYSESFSTRAEAMQREKYFKSLKNKEYLKEFIRSQRNNKHA